MVSKEEFKRYVDELTKEDSNKTNLRYISNSYSSISAALILIGAIVFVVGIFTALSGGLVLCVIGTIVIMVAASMSFNVSKARNSYKDKYLDNIIKYLLKGYDYKFDRYGQIEESVFLESQFETNYDKYRGLDKLSINIPNDDGTRSNTYINLCDLDVISIQIDSEGRKRKYIKYRGVFGYVDFSFEFKCLLGINTKYRKSGVSLEKVSLEDLEFHKKFGVYCSDQIEARYILTPEMMEKLLVLYDKFKGVKMVLVDNKMYFGFPGDDFLEFGSYRGDMLSVFDDLYDDISNILSIVEEIKNNNKIFRM